ncbi:hypothetical protein WICMUC_001676 [Wickerhamomyces mucosus]|uniref:AB hydrolase-1 domain-containing protein n=1 Tax=Wickerhamomyces mucosus TaxID=1378264 RepID=A0A9P8PU01_9ASCO|nr:hypothetical protein WICMUC_001676 [Wickerhamomyces mucosus]
MPQSLEKYLTLSKQEQSPPLTFRQKISIYFQSLIYGSIPFTPLEQILIDDQSFVDPIVDANQFITIDQYKISYIYIPAKDEKETVLVIHGVGGTFKQFDSFIVELIQLGYGVLAFDQPGSGDSLAPPNTKLTSEFLTKYSYKLIEKLNLFDKISIILGHSYGSQISINLLINYNNKNVFHNIKEIWLVTPPPFKERSKVDLLRTTLFHYNPWVFEAFRKIGRLNNINSPSLKFIIETDDEYLRFKQLKFNLKMNSKNFVNQRYHWIPLISNDFDKFKNVVQSNQIQLYLVDGDSDKVCKNSAELIYNYLNIGKYILFEKGGHNFLVDRSIEFAKLFQKLQGNQ